MTNRRDMMLGGLALMTGSAGLASASGPVIPESARSKAALARVGPKLGAELRAKGLSLGDPLYVRILKSERRLETWLQAGGQGAYRLFKVYPVCSFSGRLGPKLKEGDRQAPEGFYRVGPGQLNPRSSFHLSFDLGFPNRYDRAHGRTGSYLMVHGSCVSVGCYAMTDDGIEEIYALLDAGLRRGQVSVPVDIFPFRMEPALMRRYQGSPWAPFWREIEPGYRAFEETRLPPRVKVVGKAYRVAL